MSFNYTEGSHVPKSSPRGTDKRGTSSATQLCYLSGKQISKQKNRLLGNLLLGIILQSDAVLQWSMALVGYVEEGGLLKTHDDVPESIREKLYIQEQQRLERQKGGTQSTNGYPPINITNVLPVQASPLSMPTTPTPMPILCPGKAPLDFFEIPGLRDLAVAEYSDWQQSQVNDEKLKQEFRKARDTALEDGQDLVQIYKY
ncbi:hypothetical protein N7513_004754 [Penicillium frequentans]|nr:hypothetical protein N7513_004754 [Penicillium glabrum]